ncbi:MAG: response regulator [Lachnospiraceae bacterium]|nr:response regulator [Lachnospiraceae bacterium]
MRKVLLVDDEPFILQGLKAVVDWKAEGFEVVATCANGLEAYEYLKKSPVDVILADIKMPEMTGIELLKRIREERISDAFFIILTGFKDFTYIQTALRYDCMEYMLKPVEKTELIGVLRKIAKVSDEREEEAQSRESMEQAYLARNLMALLFGKYDAANVTYVRDHLHLSDEIRYVDIEMSDYTQHAEELEEGEMKGRQRQLYSAVRDYLREEKDHCIFDVSHDERNYDIGLIYCDYFASKRGMGPNDLLEGLHDHVLSQCGFDVNIFVGKAVDHIDAISKSYTSACMLRSLEAFRTRKNIYYYDDEAASDSNSVIILKDRIDSLIDAISSDDTAAIRTGVDAFYGELGTGTSPETVRLNVNYLLFTLIHMATQLDDDLDQEEILRFIAEHSSEEGILRGSSAHMASFCCDYAQYLTQLRKNVSGGVLLEIEKEIRDNYADNLTLRDLGKKYFVNSSYLGQMFQKKYGKSFKDYLTSYRIGRAEELLTSTDLRIAQIAERVGYRDNDYFLKKFIEANGCTPSKFRKNNI